MPLKDYLEYKRQQIMPLQKLIDEWCATEGEPKEDVCYLSARVRLGQFPGILQGGIRVQHTGPGLVPPSGGPEVADYLTILPANRKA